MALPRSLQFLRVGTGGQALEVYLDPICPYSAKITRALDAHVVPLITKGGKYEGKLHLIARIYPQPFHYSSGYHTEALIAFGKHFPDIWWSYLLKLFETQKSFFNVPAQDLTLKQIRNDIVDLGVDVAVENKKFGQTIDSDKSDAKEFKEQFLDALTNKVGPGGTTNDVNSTGWQLKYLIKIGRQNGVHVTPTVLFDGLKEDSVSSSWEREQWEKFLDDKLSGP